jgi:hypothetical protein
LASEIAGIEFRMPIPGIEDLESQAWIGVTSFFPE